jgi:hypothetical protein
MATVWTVSALVLGLVVGCVVGFVVRRRSASWCWECGANVGRHCAACVGRQRAGATVHIQSADMAAHSV